MKKRYVKNNILSKDLIKYLGMSIIYFASGATSNFVTTTFFENIALYLKDGKKVYATVRDETSNGAKFLSNLGVTFISQQESLSGSFKPERILWFSTHDDVELLTKYSSMAPTLLISSGAMMPFIENPELPAETNPYGYKKYQMAKVSGVYVFVPGFFIEDTGFYKKGDRLGLHSATTNTIFGKHGVFNNTPFDWGRAYSVTPKSFLKRMVGNWIENPKCFEKKDSQGNLEPIIMCTDRVYRRWELRSLAGLSVDRDGDAKGLNLSVVTKKEYEKYFHVETLSEEDIKEACLKVRVIDNE